MPRLRRPFTAMDCLVFLKKAEETTESDSGDGKKYISNSTINKSKQLTQKLESGLGNLGGSKSLSQKEIREKNQSITHVSTYVRDICEGVRRRVYRENLPLEVFAFYQMPKTGKTPIINSDGQLMELASLIIAGDATAIEQGYAPISNPSVAELQIKLDKARKEAKDVAVADKQLDEAQEAVSGLMPEAKELVDRVIAELNFNLYDKDDASKRRIMRNYGVRFEFTKNEPAEDDSDIVLS
jgi:hypothetical protein